NFLDVTIGAQSGQICTNLYRKPTDKPQYLHFSSEHPHHTKISLPYCLALRCKRICSQEDLLENHFNILKNQFLNRGYPEKLIDNAIGRAYGADDVTYTKNRNSDTAETVNFITTYHSQNPNFNNILSKNYPILVQETKHLSVFKAPPRTVFKRLPNLKSMLVNSTVNKPRTPFEGSNPCKKSRCLICIQMEATSSIKSLNRQFIFRIKGNFNCDAFNCVYVLECNKCNLQYVGETIDFRHRINNHKSRFRTDLVKIEKGSTEESLSP